MYDVFLTHISTSMGVHFLRANEEDRGVQAVWRDYKRYMEKSTKANLQVSTLLTELTTQKLEPGSRESSQDFILNWHEKVREFEELTPVDAHFPDSLKKIMLETALQGLKCFRDIKISETMDMARGKGELSYEEYITTAQNTAVSHDLTEAKFRMRRQAMRAVRRAETNRSNRFDNYEDQEQWEMSEEEEFCLVDEENEDIEVHYVGQERKAFI